eukprot:TRINITY_DN16867_c0_g1_i1.p1 TRINITY_DN16867_c0_g1~~TRINITY_DN16867_c0_g1_i1.p1  ORF type:complete len:375 (+),score=121.24 TRINITY_DN16867_c0_g1_i1:50-1174(+)
MEVDKDPCTGLPLVQVPPAFSALGVDDAALHWIGRCVEYGSGWEAAWCVCMLGRDCLYCCSRAGQITHAVPVADIEELLITSAPHDGTPSFGVRNGGRLAECKLLLGVDADGGRSSAERDRVTGLIASLRKHADRAKRNAAPVRVSVLTTAEAVSLRLRRLRSTTLEGSVPPLLARATLGVIKAEQVTQADLGRKVDAAVVEEVQRLRRLLSVRLAQDAHRYSLAVARGVYQHGDTAKALLATKVQLLRCQEALRRSSNDLSKELEAVHEQYLEYDCEVSRYLGRRGEGGGRPAFRPQVFARCPKALEVVGPPPTLHRVAGAPATGGAARREWLQKLTAENAELRRRIRDHCARSGAGRWAAAAGSSSRGRRLC